MTPVQTMWAISLLEEVAKVVAGEPEEFDDKAALWILDIHCVATEMHESLPDDVKANFLLRETLEV